MPLKRTTLLEYILTTSLAIINPANGLALQAIFKYCSNHDSGILSMRTSEGELLLFPNISPKGFTVEQSSDSVLVSCGIAGWSYPDWDGYVYAPKTKDKLGFIAGFVDMIEINNTFYRPPEAKTTESWIKRIQHFPGFFFTAKLHREITHEGIINDRTIKAFHDGLEPMVKSNRLRHLLAQFRHDFDSRHEHREHLKKITDNFQDMTNLVLEFRHNSWQTRDSLEFLESLKVTVANLDYPESNDSFNLRETGIGKDAYLRLHGRNAKAWFDKKAGRDETYNYYYSEEELSGIKDRAKRIANKSKTLTIVTNNHYQGKEVANILQLKAMLSGNKVDIPPRLLEKYPKLRDIKNNPEL